MHCVGDNEVMIFRWKDNLETVTKATKSDIFVLLGGGTSFQSRISVLSAHNKMSRWLKKNTSIDVCNKVTNEVTSLSKTPQGQRQKQLKNE